METMLSNLNAISAARVRLRDLNMQEVPQGIAWSCIVYLNGKRLGTIQDPGEDHPLTIGLEQSQVQALAGALKKQGYKLNAEAAGRIDVENDNEYLEQVLPQMADEVEWFNKAKGLLKSNTLFRIKGDVDETFRVVLAPYSDKTQATLRQLYGDDLELILNTQLRGVVL